MVVHRPMSPRPSRSSQQPTDELGAGTQRAEPLIHERGIGGELPAVDELGQVEDDMSEVEGKDVRTSHLAGGVDQQVHCLLIGLLMVQKGRVVEDASAATRSLDVNHGADPIRVEEHVAQSEVAMHEVH